ncbi:MAG: 4Fe-4S binding protein [Actinobacteria bacterium]|nr:4Fe-4S binding protein [Actinomycetota bacterium]
MAARRGRSKKSFDRFLRLYKYKDTAFKMTNWPLFKQAGRRVLDAENTCLTYVPIYEDMELPPGVAAPVSVIEHFIREASHHLILSRCPCRSENGCEEFDPYFGCTFLGPAVLDVDPEVGRLVSTEEALEHLRQATEMGLVSCLGKFKGDAIMLGLKDHHRLMTICHCCPCCCISTAIPLASRETRDVLVKMEGLTIAVDEAKCNGCGKCVKACIFDQITLADREPSPGGNGQEEGAPGEGRRPRKLAVIGEECKGCGRCAMVCKQGAISVRIDDPSYIEACVERISAKVEIR